MAEVAAPARQTRVSLERSFRAVRGHTEELCSALTAEDQCLQSMPDASPAKWHRAHTTWFFEEFVLGEARPGARFSEPMFRYLFNSYYEAVGERHPRPARGLLTRPGADEVTAYRHAVNAGVIEAMATIEGRPRLRALLELGLHHEQQHQELLVTDTLHGFAQSPVRPAVLPGWSEAGDDAGPSRMAAFGGGLMTAGVADDDPAFCFDNERPAHQTMVAPFCLATGLVTNAEFAAFIGDGGYRKPALWMADGWDRARAENWGAPLYWWRDGDGWRQMGPGGDCALVPNAPVRHVSWYEADAFARWAGCRLPTEFEWEYAVGDRRLREMHGVRWQWTSSAYGPYPGYRPAAGAVGEYSGKFMVNQMVLRGSSRVTPAGHARDTYRNFFHPDRRWQFSGIRLAADN